MKICFVVLMLVFAVSALFARKYTGALLWKISGNGLNHPSYIFGTHHAYPLSFLDSVPGVKKAFEASEQLVGELPLSDMPALTVELYNAGTMPQDTTYRMLLSEEDYLFADQQLTSLVGAGFQILGKFKPSMISMTYTAVLYQKLFPQAKPGEAMDMWFQQQATGRQMPVVGLETVQDQISAIINVAPLKHQSEDMLCGLRNTAYMETLAKKLSRFYRTADFVEMYALMNEKDSPCPWTEKEEAAINKNRNERWLEKLPALMSEKPCFVAVGCIHLIGEVGLLEGLANMGYTVEAVRKYSGSPKE